MISQAVLNNRFVYHVPKEGQAARYQGLRDMGKNLAEAIVSISIEWESAADPTVVVVKTAAETFPVAGPIEEAIRKWEMALA